MSAPAKIILNKICLKPEFMPSLLDAMSNGELLVDFCAKVGIRYSDVMNYVMSDPIRAQQWTATIKDGQSRMINQLLSELSAISTVDVKDAFLPSGEVKPIDDMPPSLRRAIASIEVEEIWDHSDRGRKVQVGVLKKIKMNDKLRAIELLGKQLRMFVDQVVVSGEVKVTHHVEKYDLEERIKMIKEGKLKAVYVPRETLPVAGAEIQEATIIEKAGADI